MKEHRYHVGLLWTGNTGYGTKSYDAYRRDHEIVIDGKPAIPGSSDPAFRGDPARYNPEEMLVSSLSSCHMLWYLHLCASNQIVVTGYRDSASGLMRERPNGAGEFVEVLLRPQVQITSGDPAIARDLHRAAHEFCFIARSVNFPVKIEPQIIPTE